MGIYHLKLMDFTFQINFESQLIRSINIVGNY